MRCTSSTLVFANIDTLVVCFSPSACSMQSMPASVQYKRQDAIAGGATISQPLLHGLDLNSELFA
jgi:hypothetical protein